MQQRAAAVSAAAADVLVVGGGCIGLSTSSEIARRRVAGSVLLLEQEASCGLHASTRNSSVLHAGFYYSQDSFKAKLTRKGHTLPDWSLLRFVAWKIITYCL